MKTNSVVILRRVSLVIPSLLIVGLGFAQNKKEVKPNIIVIMADDMGYGDISALNPESKIHTPVLDGLINEGRNFTNASTTASLCTPARYAFLTGRYNFRTGISGVASGYSRPMIEFERKTVASLLKQSGYTTAIIGKWHLGLQWQPKNPKKPIYTKDDYIPENLNVDYTKQVKGVNEVGFDYSFISAAGNNLSPFCFIKNGKVTEFPSDNFEPKITDADGRNFESRHNGGDKAPGYDLSTTLGIITNQAVQYLKNNSKNKKPFFLYWALTAPHFPWVPETGFKGTSQAGAYGDYMQQIDAKVGLVLQALKDEQIDGHTLVIFTADNGGAIPEGFFEKYRHAMNYGRRGEKGEIWEGGVHVPFIARWPGKISAGTSSDACVSLVDLMATFARLAGIAMPPEYGEDSYDVSSAFLSTGEAVIRRGPLVNQSGDVKGLDIIDDNWKLIPYGYGRHGLDAPKANEPNGQLYDLASDPMENKNVYNQHSDIVKRLSALLAKYKAQGYSRPEFKRLQKQPPVY